MTVLRAHPIAELFPMMSDEQLQAFAKDVKANGLRRPIITIEENGERLVLDGRNRYRACAMSGVEPRFEVFAGTDPFALVVSENLIRRDLTVVQKIEIAESMAKLKHGGDRSKASRDALTSETSSQAEAAKLMGVSRPSVQRMRVVKEQGVPELAAAVVAGEIAVKPGAEIARLPHAEQRQLLASGAKSVAEQRSARIFEHNGSTAKEIKSGVVLVKGLPVDDASTNKTGSGIHSDNREVVRRLTREGLTATDIAERTGIKRSFIHHVRAEVSGPRSVLAGPTVDAEVFAESWARRAADLDPRWLSAPSEERAALVAALKSCRSAVQRMIQRLNKEAKGVTDNEICEVEA